MIWHPATISAARMENPRARTLALEVDGWPGHVAGQHVDVRLTADDGYTAVRSYSIAASAASSELEITVDRLEDGEVSPYLVDIAEVGDRVEIRGPAGGWFVWRHESDLPVQLIGGGSGIVPLMSMIRTHCDERSSVPFRLLYAVRSPEFALFRDELLHRETDDTALELTWAFSRAVPDDWPSPPAHIDRDAVVGYVFDPAIRATVYVCGSTPFVEAVATWLVDAGHDPADIRTERYGGV